MLSASYHGGHGIEFRQGMIFQKISMKNVNFEFDHIRALVNQGLVICDVCISNYCQQYI